MGWWQWGPSNGAAAVGQQQWGGSSGAAAVGWQQWGSSSGAAAVGQQWGGAAGCAHHQQVVAPHPAVHLQAAHFAHIGTQRAVLTYSTHRYGVIWG